MLEPQGTLIFLLLVVIFVGLMVWLILTKHLVLRVVAAMLAFLPAMAFGVVAVNKYFAYYQTWSAMIGDLTGQSDQGTPQAPTMTTAAGMGLGKNKSISSWLNAKYAQNPSFAQDGFHFREVVTGPKSHITREVYIYLPPQYFEKAYEHYRFPAIELLHGSPGNPESWINIMDVTDIYAQELRAHTAQPAILVMPDTNGGLQYNEQCLNQPGGQQDMTFVGKEVPDWVASPASSLRVQPPGQMWGIAGYSEGGYCAANIALQYASRFGFAGSFSGYFVPDPRSQVPAHNKPGGAPVLVNNFTRNPALRVRNTPLQYISRVPVGVVLPKFYLASGTSDPESMKQLTEFSQLLQNREATVPIDYVPGGGHTAGVWRAAVQWMLPPMTNELFALAQNHQKPTPAAPPVNPKLAPGKLPLPASPLSPLVSSSPLGSAPLQVSLSLVHKSR